MCSITHFRNWVPSCNYPGTQPQFKFYFNKKVSKTKMQQNVNGANMIYIHQATQSESRQCVAMLLETEQTMQSEHCLKILSETNEQMQWP